VLLDSPSLPGKLQATSPLSYQSKSGPTSSLSSAMNPSRETTAPMIVLPIVSSFPQRSSFRPFHRYGTITRTRNGEAEPVLLSMDDLEGLEMTLESAVIPRLSRGSRRAWRLWGGVSLALTWTVRQDLARRRATGARRPNQGTRSGSSLPHGGRSPIGFRKLLPPPPEVTFPVGSGPARVRKSACIKLDHLVEQLESYFAAVSARRESGHRRRKALPRADWCERTP
jgi:antitoxin YefM